MQHSSAWDEPYAADDYMFSEEPNRFLVAECARLRPGMTALAIGDGEGRNGVWLARQGIDVLSIDLSAVGLAKARRLANRHRVAIRTRQMDANYYDWPADAFDIVLSIFVHFELTDRSILHARMQHSLQPGGTIILVAFGERQARFDTGGPRRQELLYTIDELRRDFAGMIVHRLEEREEELLEGRAHTGMAHLLCLVASKPLP